MQRQVQTMLTNGLRPNSVRAVIAPLREFFNHMLEEGHVERNPY